MDTNKKEVAADVGGLTRYTGKEIGQSYTLEQEGEFFLAEDVERLLATKAAEGGGHRECNACDWKGATDRMLGSIGPLCPECGETTEVAAHPAEAAQSAPAPWEPLNDVQWMNIVNHDHAYESFSKDEAVHEAVKRTEAKLKEINARAAYSAQAAPQQAVPEGFALVPIEPTEDMVTHGFESSSDPFFSKPEDWGAYEAMTGCQQAAHRARLCWAAMLAAIPVPPVPAPSEQGDDESLFWPPKALLKREDWDPLTRKPKASAEQPSAAGSANGGNDGDELPISRSTYGSLAECEAEQARRNLAHVARQPAAATAEPYALYDRIVRLSERFRQHPQLKAVIGREALILRCVDAVSEPAATALLVARQPQAAPSPAAAQEGEQGSAQTSPPEQALALVNLLQRWASWIVREHPKNLMDHACARCVPHSDMLVEGFNCVYHEAVDTLGGLIPRAAPSSTEASARAAPDEVRLDGYKLIGIDYSTDYLVDVRNQALEEAAVAVEALYDYMGEPYTSNSFAAIRALRSTSTAAQAATDAKDKP